jgi:L-histidine N-alpha-methyltransferase
MHEHSVQTSFGEGLIDEVHEGLSQSQKQLSSKLFYDERGSELFDEITGLSEYYPTRLERMLLRSRGAAWIRSFEPRSLIEMGAGSADKTRALLDAMPDGALYVPIDISASYLSIIAEQVGAEYPQLTIAPVEADISDGPVVPDGVPAPSVVAFLGSTIGNFDRAGAVRLLKGVRDAITRGDRFLMGADLVKDTRILERAYNDSAGVTAAFNLNVLDVLNRELDADFDSDAFEHRAFFNSDASRIEMHLVSKDEQVVTIPNAGGFHFDAGESILTEISCKYTRASLKTLFDDAGLVLEDWMTDASQWYAIAVGRVAR